MLNTFSFKKIAIGFSLILLVSGCGPVMPRKPENRDAVYTYCKNTANTTRYTSHNECLRVKSAEYINSENYQQYLADEIKKQEAAEQLDNYLSNICLHRQINPFGEGFKLCKMQVLNELEQKQKYEQMEKRLKAQMREMEWDAYFRETQQKLQSQGQKITDDSLKNMNQQLEKTSTLKR